MWLFLIIFSLFNLAAGAVAAGAAFRLTGEGGDTGWASRRLYWIARIMTGGLAALGIGLLPPIWALSTIDIHYALLILIPIGWTLVMGLVFAVIDFAEDGVFDFGRGAPKKS